MPKANLCHSRAATVLAIAMLLLGCQVPLDAQESSTEALYLETERIPINNCGGSAQVTVHRVVSRTFYHEVYVETAAQAGLDAFVVSSGLEQRYGYQNGQADTRSFGVDLTAPAHSKVVYVLEWKEIWVRGIVYDPNTGETHGTYRLRKDIQMQIVDSYSEGC